MHYCITWCSQVRTSFGKSAAVMEGAGVKSCLTKMTINVNRITLIKEHSSQTAPNMGYMSMSTIFYVSDFNKNDKFF